VHTGGRPPNWDHLHAIWYIHLNGCAWRALPSEFGKWFTVFQFLNRLSRAGFTEFLHAELLTGTEAEAVFFDSTHVKVHQHANGPGTQEEQAIGASRGGLNTKIHIMVDALGRLAGKMVLTPGNTHDCAAAPKLLSGLKDQHGVGDKAYDSKSLRAQIRKQGGEPCVPSRSSAKVQQPYCKTLYRTRHCVENKFQRIKVFRRVAMRFEKTQRMFLLFVTLAIAATYERDGLWDSM
jgi:transposase